jgi:hypothetical protein
MNFKEVVLNGQFFLFFHIGKGVLVWELFFALLLDYEG